MYCWVSVFAWLPLSVSTTGGIALTSTVCAVVASFRWTSRLTVSPTLTMTPVIGLSLKPVNLHCNFVSPRQKACKAILAGLVGGGRVLGSLGHLYGNDARLREDTSLRIRHGTADAA